MNGVKSPLFRNGKCNTFRSTKFLPTRTTKKKGTVITVEPTALKKKKEREPTPAPYKLGTCNVLQIVVESGDV